MNDTDYIILVCSHKFISRTFRPDTRVTTYSSLADSTPTVVGLRSQQSSYECSWTILDLGRVPPPSRCCSNCNPHLLDSIQPAGPLDTRLYAFASDFIHPLALPPSRPTSAMSNVTQTSRASSNFVPVKEKQNVSRQEKDRLRGLLTDWLNARHVRRGSSVFISRDFGLPPKQMEKLVSSSGKFLSVATVTEKQVLGIVHLDLAIGTDLADICSVISDWRDGMNISRTPHSQKRPTKRTRAETPVVPQPNFGSPAISPSTPRQSQQRLLHGT